jgi:PIN domain nuclease of toxin-antitoxin system
MRILLDTNALLWAAYQPERLTSKAAKAYLSADEIHFSVISGWEIESFKCQARCALNISRSQTFGVILPGTARRIGNLNDRQRRPSERPCG